MFFEVVQLERGRRAGVVGRVTAAWSEVSASARRAGVMASVATVIATLAWSWWTPAAWATGVALAVLLAAALVDMAERHLPNALVLAAAAPVAFAVVAAALGGRPVTAGAAVGALAAGVPLLLTHLVSPAGLGFGDVKAGTVLGGALGLLTPVLAPAALLVGLLGSASWAIAGRRRSVPLGPGLVGGGIVAVLLGRVIGVQPW